MSKTYLKKTVFAVMAVSLAVLAAELITRLSLKWLIPEQEYFVITSRTQGLGEVPLYQPHHYLDYVLTPNYQHPLLSTRHNKHAFRGPEIVEPKPQGRFRIACLGGSTTYTIAVFDDAKTYPAQLEKILKQHYPQRDIEVINAGVGGYTTAEMLLNYIFKVSELEVDAIILYEGVNDIHPRIRPNWNRDYSGYRKIWQRERHFYDPIVEKSLMLRYILYTFDRLPIEQLYIYTTLPRYPTMDAYYFAQTTPDIFEKNLRALIQLAQANDVKVMLSTFAARHQAEHYIQGGKEHNEVMKKLAVEFQLPLADVVTALGEPLDELMVDTVHTNEKGSEKMAEAFAQAIAKAGWLPY